MKRIAPLTLMLFALVACDETASTNAPASSAAPKASAVAASTAAADAKAASDDIATEDDFADEAALQITAANVDTELDTIEKEIGE